MTAYSAWKVGYRKFSGSEEFSAVVVTSLNDGISKWIVASLEDTLGIINGPVVLLSVEFIDRCFLSSDVEGKVVELKLRSQ